VPAALMGIDIKEKAVANVYYLFSNSHKKVSLDEYKPLFASGRELFHLLEQQVRRNATTETKELLKIMQTKSSRSPEVLLGLIQRAKEIVGLQSSPKGHLLPFKKDA